MPRKNTPDEALSKMPQPAILALASKLHGVAKARIAAGQDVTQENIRILNNARQQLQRLGVK